MTSAPFCLNLIISEQQVHFDLEKDTITLTHAPPLDTMSKIARKDKPIVTATEGTILSSQTTPTKESPSNATNSTLQVDFAWKSFKATIIPKDDPEATPLYLVSLRCFNPHLIFQSPADESTIATSQLHVFNIRANCTVNGHAIELKPLKRFDMKYNYLSQAFVEENGAQAVMIWEGSCTLKTWNFTLMKEDKLPVAKLSCNVFGVHDIGSIEFMPSTAIDCEMRDEIVVTGLTLFQQMVLRSSNVVSLAGAVFAKPGIAGDNTSS